MAQRNSPAFSCSHQQPFEADRWSATFLGAPSVDMANFRQETLFVNKVMADLAQYRLVLRVPLGMRGLAF